MPEIVHLVEASVYVQDLKRSNDFYQGILGLEKIGEQDGRHLLFRVGESMLLLFNAESTRKGGFLPGHGATGEGHFALGVPTQSELSWWREHLLHNNVEIEREVDWSRGGKSIYFRDPDGNLVELITPGCWGLPSGW